MHWLRKRKEPTTTPSEPTETDDTHDTDESDNGNFSEQEAKVNIPLFTKCIKERETHYPKRIFHLVSFFEFQDLIPELLAAIIPLLYYAVSSHWIYCIPPKSYLINSFVMIGFGKLF
jgi:hypothetical protein